MDLERKRQYGAALWGVGMVVALGWASLGHHGAGAVGYGFAPAIEVAALETARVQRLPVGLHDAVTDGEVVVELDPTPLVEQRQVAEANLKAVREEQARLAQSDVRKYSQGVETNLVSQAKISAQLQEDQAQLQTLQERLRLEQDLATQGASSSQAVEEWNRQIRVVEARIGANRSALGAASGAVAGSIERKDALPAANQWEVEAASRQLEEIDGRIARYALQARITGQVSWIWHQPGEVVPAGQPILQVRRTGTREVVAFVAPSRVTGLGPGTPATVRRSTGEVVQGKLVSVGIGPQALPPQLWKMPGWPEYGVPVRVELESEIAPDEPVNVRL